MRSILHSHKKGVSELISYTLLIILAVSASVLVYNYLKGLVPKDKPTCEDNSLILGSYTCKFISSPSDSKLNITLLNKGRFTVDGVYLRIGEINKSARRLINLDSLNLISINPLTGNPQAGLIPQTQITKEYNFSTNTVLTLGNDTDYALEIQPAMYDENTKKLAACNSFIQTIHCK